MPGARPFVSVTQQFNATTSNGAPDPERLVVLCPLITGGAVLEYSPTEKSPPFGKMFTRPACLCRPRPLVWARIPAGKPRLLDPERRIPARDRFAPDSPLEGSGFEPVWGFSCQVMFLVFLFGAGSRSSPGRLRSGSRSARKGSRDRNGSKA